MLKRKCLENKRGANKKKKKILIFVCFTIDIIIVAKYSFKIPTSGKKKFFSSFSKERKDGKPMPTTPQL